MEKRKKQRNGKEGFALKLRKNWTNSLSGVMSAKSNLQVTTYMLLDHMSLRKITAWTSKLKHVIARGDNLLGFHVIMP
jgi:hypothetical protein